MQALYLLLGSNKGNRFNYLDTAKKHLSASIGAIENESSFYETAAWGNREQDNFINQAILIYSSEPATTLLKKIKQIEIVTGRTSSVHWGAREIDIDILIYGEELVSTDLLKIPHASLHERKFALLPLFEIAPDTLHIGLQKTIRELLVICKDTLTVELIKR